MLNTDRSQEPCDNAVQMKREPINVNNNDIHEEALEAHQRKYNKGKDNQKDPSVFIAGATVAVQ